MTLFRAPLLVIDTETTGIYPKHPWARVIELAAVLLDEDGNEVAVFESLVKPDVLDERANEALAINQITHEMLADAPSTAEVVDTFQQWTGGGSPWATSFNVAFDRGMVERMGVEELRWASCVMLRASNIMGPAGALPRGKYGQDWKWPKLSEAVAFFDIQQPPGAFHRALFDARCAAGIAVAIRRRELERAS